MRHVLGPDASGRVPIAILGAALLQQLDVQFRATDPVERRLLARVVKGLSARWTIRGYEPLSAPANPAAARASTSSAVRSGLPAVRRCGATWPAATS